MSQTGHTSGNAQNDQKTLLSGAQRPKEPFGRGTSRASLQAVIQAASARARLKFSPWLRLQDQEPGGAAC
jgi:hypothetical protein